MNTARFFAVAAVALGLGVAPARASQPLLVDKDHVQCPDAPFASIEEAVQAAAPGETIVVCPDLYTERVTVDKPIVLLGASSGATAAGPGCFRPSRPDPTRDAIVVSPDVVFDLASDDITLDGFVIGPMLGYTSTGVETYGVGGLEIRNNVFEDEVNNLWLRGGGVETSFVRGNCFQYNRLTGGTSSDRGIFATAASNVRILDNAFFRTNNALALRGGTDLTVANNDSRENGVFVDAQGGSGIAILDNQVQDDGYGVRLLFGSAFDVSGNSFRHVVRSGISVSVLDSTISENDVRDSGEDGLQVLAGGSGNLIEQNTLLNNGQFDCRDDTVGPGTAGTANFWIDDVGKTENRPGLCR